MNLVVKGLHVVWNQFYPHTSLNNLSWNFILYSLYSPSPYVLITFLMQVDYNFIKLFIFYVLNIIKSSSIL